MKVPWSVDDVPASLDAVMRAALQRVWAGGAKAAGSGDAPAGDTGVALPVGAPGPSPEEPGPAEPSPGQLAEAALVCLRDAVRLGDDRSAAIHLLGADALITAACEQAAATGDADAVASLRTLCDAFTVERVAARVVGAHDHA
jgi:hypothetical protein